MGPELKLVCADCGKEFRWRKEKLCPSCGSDWVIEVRVCAFCGERLKPEEVMFCEECYGRIIRHTRAAINRVGDLFDCDDHDARALLRYGLEQIAAEEAKQNDPAIQFLMRKEDQTD